MTTDKVWHFSQIQSRFLLNSDLTLRIQGLGNDFLAVRRSIFSRDVIRVMFTCIVTNGTKIFL